MGRDAVEPRGLPWHRIPDGRWRAARRAARWEVSKGCSGQRARARNPRKSEWDGDGAEIRPNCKTPHPVVPLLTWSNPVRYLDITERGGEPECIRMSATFEERKRT